MPRTFFIYRRLLPMLSALILGMAPAMAQLPRTPQSYIAEGTAFHQKGQYRQALEKYNKAIELNATYDQAYYQMAQAYYSLKEYGKCIAHCDLALNQKATEYLPEANLLKGNALYAMGEYASANEAYAHSLEAEENYQTYYALAKSQFKAKLPKKAQESLSMALSLKSTHAESHLLLAKIMEEQGEYLPAALALTNFLLLEPRGNRAEKAHNDLRRLLSSEATLANTAPELSMDEVNKTAERVVSLLNTRKKNDTESVFMMDAQALFATLHALHKTRTDFWWNFYVSFYSDLYDAGQIETLCYFISQSTSGASLDWLQLNPTRVEQLFDWVNGYTRKY